MSFFTQDGDKYTGNVNCEITYEKADTCKQLLFDCEEFSLGKGDFLAVSRQTKKVVKTRRYLICSIIPKPLILYDRILKL